MSGLCLPGASGFDCSIIWIIWIVIFFITAILRKQINDNLSVPFSLIGGTAGGIILMIVFFYLPWIGGIKWSVLGGIIGLLGGGFGGPYLGLPDTEASE